MFGEDVLALDAATPAGASLIGVDLGTRTIGLAVSDARRCIASPLLTLARGKFTADVARMAEIAQARGAAGYVVGLPRNMDGSEGPRAQASRAFARRLAQVLDVPVALWDERLSTCAVERTLIAADASRKRRAELVDKMAAAYILQGALDRIGWAARAKDDERG
ncbi:MAG: Holliday junction resolvase RuvX [Rubrimonas sp.]|uniref:Holliday junction resolvase RuvX n=1 Tax=Rubrimonas sp. TaxID=2036015 RepID=UPI002FDD65D2